jgi:hypothetical protein
MMHLSTLPATGGRRTGLVLGILLTGILFANLGAGQAFAFVGTLSSLSGEILGTGNWLVATAGTSLSWQVTPNGDGSWSYQYDFCHPIGATSHFILEVSPTFTMDQLFGAHGDFGNIDLGTWSVSDGNSNPSMPAPIYGLKFDGATGLDTHIYFDSWRAPVWGDFYSKDGNAGGHGPNAAWNAGLSANDTDPTGPAADGSVLSHILRPDTYDKISPVPEPGTFVLLGLGLAGAAIAARRRRA